MNNVSLVGRLTRTPELKTTSTGTAYVNFTVTVVRAYKNAQGERETDFISCVAWRKTAEFIGRYFTKGKPISVTGNIQSRPYDVDTGGRIYITEVNVQRVEFVPIDNQLAEDDIWENVSIGDSPFDF